MKPSARLAAVLFGLLAASAAGRPAAGRLVQDRPVPSALDAFLDKAAERVKTLAELKDYSATVVSVQTEMDRNWKPEAVTRIKKTVVIAGGEREETILEATETKKGKTRDTTAAVAAEALKEQENRRKARAERAARAQAEPRRAGGQDLDEILPFSAKKRPEYVFTRVESAPPDEPPSLVLDFEPKVKGEDQWAGRLWFDPATADLRRAEIRLAETPAFVKELEIGLSFTTLPSGPIAIKSTRVRVNAGFFLKRVRQVSEDEYSNYVVRD